jgi:hypothetical protein
MHLQLQSSRFRLRHISGRRWAISLVRGLQVFGLQHVIEVLLAARISATSSEDE